jgi:hypothetical protein
MTRPSEGTDTAACSLFTHSFTVHSFQPTQDAIDLRLGFSWLQRLLPPLPPAGRCQYCTLHFLTADMTAEGLLWAVQQR